MSAYEATIELTRREWAGLAALTWPSVSVRGASVQTLLVRACYRGGRKGASAARRLASIARRAQVRQ